MIGPILAVLGLTLGSSLHLGAALPPDSSLPGSADRADSGGAMIVPQVPPGHVIDINGLDADWPAEVMPFTLTGSLSGTGKMVIRRPDDPMEDEELYVFATINDPVTAITGIATQSDRFYLLFDLSHDHETTIAPSWNASDDRGLRITRGGIVQRVYGSIASLQTDEDPTPFPAGRVAVISTGSSWSLELRLLPLDLGLNSFNALMGAAIVGLDASANGLSGLWPSTATDDPATWVNLITRVPFDYILLLDQSGSMSGQKWDATLKAGNNFALVLGRLKDTELNDNYTAIPGVNPDRLGLATFTWRSGAFHTEGKPLAAVPVAPGNYTGGLSAPGGLTPIAAGVNHAVTMLGGLPELQNNALARRRLLLLLSDGKHNRPTTTLDLTPGTGDLTYHPPSVAASAMNVNPVGLGTDATVDTDKLNLIKNLYGKVSTSPGDTDLFFYNLALPTGEVTARLTKYFVQTILPFYDLNILDEKAGGTIGSFEIRAGERNLMLFAFWDDASTAVPLTVKLPQADGSPGAVQVVGTVDNALGYSFLVLDDPAFGTYTDFEATGANYLMVLLDLRIQARFGIDAASHGTGSDIILRARLREDGRPLTGADVRVDITRPGEGLGTLASTVDLETCRASAPSLPPPIDISREQLMRGGVRLPETSLLRTRDAPSAAAVGQPADPDPNPYLYQWAEAYLRSCGGGALPRAEDTGIPLRDDGTGGDARAADGIYTLRMPRTEFEGSYTFRFQATGTASDGRPFRRIAEIGEYVFVDPSPATSEAGSRTHSQSGTLIVVEFFVLPRDQFGGYMGPGRGEHVRFEPVGTPSGTVVSDVLDYRNGYYSILVRYDAATERRPEYVPVVRGTRIEPVTPRRRFELGIHGSYTEFDDLLGLHDGFGIGGHLGVRLVGSLILEAELGVTAIDNVAGPVGAVDEPVSGHVITAFANARLDLGSGTLVPFLKAGAGTVLFRGFDDDDSALAVHGGAGVTWWLVPAFGLRAEVRALRFEEVFGSGGTTTNTRAAAGVVFRF